MQSATQTVPASKRGLWAGRIMSGLVAAFLVFDAIVKVMKLAFAVEGTAKVGYPVSVVLPLGIVLLACVVLYVIPGTSVFGAILLTGYLGGATATLVRVEDPLFLFPVGFGVLVWGGLYLRDTHLRTLLPMRSSGT